MDLSYITIAYHSFWDTYIPCIHLKLHFILLHVAIAIIATYIYIYIYIAKFLLIIDACISYSFLNMYRHPEAKGRPHSKSILKTLQKSDEILLQCLAPANDKTDSQVTMLGAPLIIGEQLYPDLQSQYRTA